MTDPSFLLQPAAAKDLMELARDLQAMVDSRAFALEQPVTSLDFDISSYASFDNEPESRTDH